MRVRGLKSQSSSKSAKYPTVAPHAGAWIEITIAEPMRVLVWVAPHAGAWIEIDLGRRRDNTAGAASHPMRVRGLKYDALCKY